MGGVGGVRGRSAPGGTKGSSDVCSLAGSFVLSEPTGGLFQLGERHVQEDRDLLPIGRPFGLDRSVPFDRIVEEIRGFGQIPGGEVGFGERVYADVSSHRKRRA